MRRLGVGLMLASTILLVALIAVSWPRMLGHYTPGSLRVLLLGGSSLILQVAATITPFASTGGDCYANAMQVRYGAACALVLAAIATLCTTGCTLYSEQKTPALAMTTSAEQVDRIFWQDVAQAKWTEANALLAPNAIWRVNGEMVPRAQIVPWLRSLGVHGVQVTNVAPTPAVNDMNLVYTVQIQADKAVRLR